MNQSILLTDSERKSYAKILPRQGAMLAELKLSGIDIIQSQVFDEERKIGFPSAILFPFPNRIADGKYTFENKEYQLEINEPNLNNALHGLVFNASFEVLNQENHSLTLIYRYRKEKLGFPFDFDLLLTFSLKHEAFVFQYQATNIGETAMPAAFGWHPYFQLQGKNIDSLKLKIPASARLGLEENKIPSGNILEQKVEQIRLENILYDDIFKEFDLQNVDNQIILSDGEFDLMMKHESNGKEKYLMIFTPSSKKCIAIEPQTANINSFNNKQGLAVLKPTESLTGEIKIQLKKTKYNNK